MNKVILGLAAAGLLTSASALAAPKLSTGTFASTGTVATTNDSQTGTQACASIGLTPGAANNSTIVYPGVSKTGFLLYVGGGGLLQLCNAFPATPATGLASWSTSGTCAVDTINGNAPPSSVAFTFSTTVTDGYSGIGMTNVSIPVGAAVGGGCQATINTTIVRSGR